MSVNERDEILRILEILDDVPLPDTLAISNSHTISNTIANPISSFICSNDPYFISRSITCRKPCAFSSKI